MNRTGSPEEPFTRRIAGKMQDADMLRMVLPGADRWRLDCPYGWSGGGSRVPLGGGAGAPPRRMGVLHSRHGTTLLRSCSSTSMYLRQRGLGHWTANTPPLGA